MHIDQEKVAYKELKKGKGEVLGVKDVKAFTIGADSFVTIHYNNYTENIPINLFLKVLLKSPGYLLFKATYLTSEYKVTPIRRGQALVFREIFLFKKGEEIHELTEYNFHNRMPEIVGDCQTLRDKIDAGKLSYKNIDNIITEYETWRKARQRNALN